MVQLLRTLVQLLRTLVQLLRTLAGSESAQNWAFCALSGFSELVPSSQNFGPGSQNFGLGSQNFGPGSQNFGLGSQNFGLGSQNFGLGSQNFGPKVLRRLGAGSENFGSVPPYLSERDGAQVGVRKENRRVLGGVLPPPRERETS